MPGYGDRERAADLIQGDDRALEPMLDDEQLFRRMVTEEEVLVHVSAWLFFTVLLRRARRELGQETFTVERRNRQKVVLFDADRVVQLLQKESLLDYLAATLASFTRIESVTVPVRVKRGIWRKYRVSDLDVESLVRFSQAVDEEIRFDSYRRIGEVCLFLTGMFPEYIEAQHRYPLSREARPGMKSRLCSSREDYERHGRAFYNLAAEHEKAEEAGLSDVLATVAEDFVLAEKPLAFLADRYLGFTRHRLFEL
jgi:hypothetical protein